MSIQDGSVGQFDFVERFGLWSEEQAAAADLIKADIEQHDLRTVRIAWGDQHGIVRGKNVMAHDFLLALKNGVDFQTATLFMDTTNNFIAPIFSSDAGLGMTALAGGPDAILVPDPTTFRVLPWAPRTGWVLSEMYLAKNCTIEGWTTSAVSKSSSISRNSKIASCDRRNPAGRPTRPG